MSDARDFKQIALGCIVNAMSQFVVTISAKPRVRIAKGRCERITARVLGQMYRDAVIAEMSETVRKAVIIHLNSNEKAVTNGVEVRLGSVVRGMGFGAVTNRGMAYMFELRDAVNEVIRTFEPPREAWVDDMMIAAPPGVIPMSLEESAQAGTRQPAPPQLDETHIHALATAAQGAHYPSLVIAEIEQAAPQYIGEAKSFLAMFNAALGILSQLFPARLPAGSFVVPPPNPQEQAKQQQAQQG